MTPLARHIGHRGVAGLAPENTLPAIRLAAQCGFRWIEIDARPSRDGVALLSHDDSLSRCGGAGRISRLTAKEAIKCRVATGKRGFSAATVPLLTDALAAAAAEGLSVVVEIKANRGEEKKAADSVAAALAAGGDAPVMVSSFQADVLRRVRQGAPAAALAWNLSRPCDWQGLRQELKLDNLHIQDGRFGNEEIAAMKAAGLGVYCFTVNDERRQEELNAAGADGVFTDFPPPPPAAGQPPEAGQRA